MRQAMPSEGLQSSDLAARMRSAKGEERQAMPSEGLQSSDTRSASSPAAVYAKQCHRKGFSLPTGEDLEAPTKVGDKQCHRKGFSLPTEDAGEA